MVFSSTIFLFLFLPIVILGYFIISKLSKNILYRNVWLLCVSLISYFWAEKKGILIIVLSIAITYISGLIINKIKYKKIFLAIAVILNLSLLFWYKYLNFAIDMTNRVVGSSMEFKDIVLPIGISFYIFQGISYIVDVYRGDTKVQKNPLIIALYISFFPQLMAGPIIRYNQIEERLNSRYTDLEMFYAGVERFIQGLAKKVLIANNVALIADKIFDSAYSTHTIDIAWLGIICYTLQIYFDFSGYTDMAIGLGKMFGFTFPENFNYPYISNNIRDFWRRWHMTLSGFFRDYLYIPLGGNRRGNVYLNLLIVFFATGLWHGASLNFIAWGLWHGLFIIIERLTEKIGLTAKNLFAKVIIHVYTLLVIIVGWVFFRSDGLHYALGYIKILFGLSSPDYGTVGFTIGYYLNPYTSFIIVIAIIICFPISRNIKIVINRLSGTTKKISIIICQILLILIFVLSVMQILNASYNPFIYFRF